MNLSNPGPEPASALAATTANANSPIADLSYRNYDGPLQTRAVRWWIVAIANLRMLRGKQAFWILAALCLLPYAPLIFQLYARAQMGGLGQQFGVEEALSNYKQLFSGAFEGQQFLLFLMALQVGSGSIASDNQANALLIYLARPITRLDYLLGKWMGVFLPMFGVAFLPALVAYLYGAFALTGPDGVWASDRILLLRILAATAVAAAIHTSLILGVSAWSKTPRMGSAIYAGVYLLSAIASGIVAAILAKGEPTPDQLPLYCSVGGAIDGLAMNIFQSVGRVPRAARNLPPETFTAPNPGLMLALGAGLILVGVLAARMKVRAVEIVKG